MSDQRAGAAIDGHVARSARRRAAVITSASGRFNPSCTHRNCSASGQPTAASRPSVFESALVRVVERGSCSCSPSAITTCAAVSPGHDPAPAGRLRPGAAAVDVPPRSSRQWPTARPQVHLPSERRPLFSKLTQKTMVSPMGIPSLLEQHSVSLLGGQRAGGLCCKERVDAGMHEVQRVLIVLNHQARSPEQGREELCRQSGFALWRSCANPPRPLVCHDSESSLAHPAVPADDSALLTRLEAGARASSFRVAPHPPGELF